MKNQRDTLQAIRALLADQFLDLLVTGEPVLDKDGNVVLGPDGKPLMKRLSPALYNTIRQFLRDNGIDRDNIVDVVGHIDRVELPYLESDPDTGVANPDSEV